MTSLANALEASMRAAAAPGPNAGMPAVRSASASPSASGASGPMMTPSAVCWRAAQVGVVVAGFGPALQLGRAHGVEGMGAEHDAEDLADAIERPARLLVLLGLDQEAVEIHLLHVPAARELEVHAERGGRVLRR